MNRIFEAQARPGRGSGLVRLYPLWQWLVLVPVMVVATVLAAPLVIVLCLAGFQHAANVHVAARWARLIAYLTPMRVRVEGREHVQDGQQYVVVSNHQSQYDIPLIYGFSRLDLRWVMKAEIGRIPFVAHGCRAIGHIFIDRSNPEKARAAINDAVAALPERTSILFFAEGTRSRSGELLKFRKGAFRVAVDRNLPVLPVTVVGTREVLPSDSLRIRPGATRLVFHPPIDPPGGPPDQAVQTLCRQTRAAIATTLESAPGRIDAC